MKIFFGQRFQLVKKSQNAENISGRFIVGNFGFMLNVASKEGTSWMYIYQMEF